MSFSVGDDRTAAGFGSPTGPGGGLEAGDVVAGRFRLMELLGEGGMGLVWKAADVDLKELVALKIVRPELMAHEAARDRFLKEIQVLRRLRHPGIVEVLDVVKDVQRSLLCYTMQLLDGRSLRARIKECPEGLPVEEARRIFDELLTAIGHAHGEGVIHRDLKPENLFLTESGLKVLDFGLAKTVATTALTLTGAGLGTVTYVAPEQKRDAGKADVRSDIFSLGVILYELLTGGPAEGNFEAVHELRREIPSAVHDAIMETLHTRPARRFGSVNEFSAVWRKAWSTAPAVENGAASPVRSGEQAAVSAPEPAAPVSIAPAESARSVADPESAEAERAPVHPAPKSSPAAKTKGRGPLVGLVLLGCAVGALLVDGMPLDFVGRAPRVVSLQPLRVELEERVVQTVGRLRAAGKVEPWARVEVNGEAILREENGAFTFATTLPEGRHQLRFAAVYPEPAELEARFGPKHTVGTPIPHRHVKAGVLPEPVVRTVIVDQSDPVIEVAELPRVASAASVKVSGKVSDLSKVTLTLAGRPLELGEAGAFAHRWSLSEGENSLALLATDEAGHTAKRMLRVTRDTSAPDITLSEALPAAVAADHVLVRGRASGAVELRAGASAVTLGDGSFTHRWPLSAGDNRLELVARDAAGNVGRKVLALIQDNEKPVLTLATLPEATKAGSIRVSGTVRDVTAVTVKLSSKSVPVKDGRFSLDWTLGSEGENRATVLAVDAVGNQATHALTIARDTTAPVFRSPKSDELTVTRGDGTFEVEVDDASAKVVSSVGEIVERGAGRWQVTITDSEKVQSLRLTSSDGLGNVRRLNLRVASPQAAAAAAAAALKDRSLWIKASKPIQDLAVKSVFRKLGSAYLHVRTKTYRCGGQSHRIATFKHKSTGLELNLIPGGRVRMGSTGEADDEKPVHPVTVKPMLIGRTEVTQAAWDRVGGEDERRWRGGGLPIEGVSWTDATAWLGKAGDGLRLPSEAEWESACRAGTTTKWSFGDDESGLSRFAWYDSNSGGKTHAIGERDPNAFGLHDMHGNVWEWCLDHWHGSYEGAPTDGSAWTTGGDAATRVVRGGSWRYSAGYARTAIRGWRSTGLRDDMLGFRVARGLD